MTESLSAEKREAEEFDEKLRDDFYLYGQRRVLAFKKELTKIVEERKDRHEETLQKAPSHVVADVFKFLKEEDDWFLKAIQSLGAKN